MAVLARAEGAALAEFTAALGALPEFEVVRPAETGTVMLEGRAGGTGQRFNLGEATVTRCVVRFGTQLGFSYALGRDQAKALLSAKMDALLQDAAWHNDVEAAVIAPLSRLQEEIRLAKSRKAAATKVDFFTLVRGDE